MTKEDTQARCQRLTSAVCAKNRTESLCHCGDHPHSFWMAHAVIVQWGMDYLEGEQKGLRLVAVEWWDNAARAGRLLDC